MYHFLMKSKIYIWFVLYFVVIVPFVLTFDMHGDTADHYLWSRYLGWNYEHPPMVAWVMWLFTFWSPYPVLTLQLGGVLLFASTLYIGYEACKDIYDEKVARIWLLMMLTAPFWTAGAIFLNVNILMLICVVSGIWVISRLIRTRNPNFLLLLGVLAGLGGLSKYIYILFCLAVAVWFVVDRQMWWVFRTWQLYMIPVITLAIFAPMVVADYENDFYSFAFNFSKGVSAQRLFTLEKVVPFVSGALLIFSPIFSVVSIIYLFQKKLFIWSEPATRFLFILAMIFLVFFTLKSFRAGSMAPNWVDVGFLALFMIVARYFEKQEQLFVRLWNWSSSILAVLFALFLLVYPGRLHTIIFPNEGEVFWRDKDTYNYQFYSYVGKKELSQDIEAKILLANGNVLPKYLVMEHYMLLGDVGANMKSEMIPYNMGRVQRNVWVDRADLEKSDIAFVCMVRFCKDEKMKFEKMFGRTNPTYAGRTEVKYHSSTIRTLDTFIYKVNE